MKNVLLIDDDPVSNFVNKRNFQLTGLVGDLQAVENGREGLAIFGSYYASGNPLPDFIFLDINMPVMNGFEFLEAFSKLSLPQKENIKIVMMSSSSDDKDIASAKKYGVSRYIFKPLTPENILTLLKE